MGKVGIQTNTIIRRSDLTRGDNKYKLNKEERKEAKNNNKKINKKNKCHGCLHNKRNTFCLAKSKEIGTEVVECNHFKKI